MASTSRCATLMNRLPLRFVPWYVRARALTTASVATSNSTAPPPCPFQKMEAVASKVESASARSGSFSTSPTPSLRKRKATASEVKTVSPDPSSEGNQALPIGAIEPLLYPKQPQRRPPLSADSRARLAQMLPLLRGQPSHYIKMHIYARAYLVTEGDQVRLPFKMPGVVPGDVLRLDRASVLGSRDLTMKGAPYIDERLFELRAIVTGTETEPLRKKVKKKRRTRRSQTVKSKHQYTILRISELKIKGPEALVD